jgi:hypothetical protein
LGFPFWPDAAGKFRIGSPWQWQSGSHLEAIWINQNQSKSINRRLAEKYGSNLDPLGRVILREKPDASTRVQNSGYSEPGRLLGGV